MCPLFSAHVGSVYAASVSVSSDVHWCCWFHEPCFLSVLCSLLLLDSFLILLPLGSLSLQILDYALGFGYQSRAGNGSHLMEWALRQIRYRLVILRSFMPQLPCCNLQARHHCISEVLCVAWCSCFSFSRMQGNFLYQRPQNVWIKAPRGHQLNFSMFKLLSRYCFQ